MSGKSPPIYDIVVAIDEFAAKSADLDALLEPVSNLFDGSNLLSVDAHYRGRSDSALLVLHLDARSVHGTLMRRIAEGCQRAACQFVQLNELPAEQRAAFKDRFLAQYEMRLTELPSISNAIAMLLGRLGMSRPRTSEIAAPRQHSPVAVRFKRSGIWHAGRLCRISENGLYVVTGALPRQADIIEVELACENLRLAIHAAVVQVSAADVAQQGGTAGFGARFVPYDRAAHVELTRFLLRASSSIQHLVPPPQRRAIRYPVAWPALLLAGGREQQMIALDVSHHGCFLGGPAQLARGTQVSIALFPDSTPEPIHANARVARVAGDGALPGGIGLELTSALETHVRRYRSLVERVARRVRYHVVVGASEQVEEIVQSLSAGGYSAAGSDDIAVVFDLVSGNTVPNAVVIDASLRRRYQRDTDVLRRKLESLSVRTVEMLCADGDEPLPLVDAALEL